MLKLSTICQRLELISMCVPLSMSFLKEDKALIRHGQAGAP